MKKQDTVVFTKINNKPRTNIPPGLQPLSPNPYQNKLRDANGVLIPQAFATDTRVYDVDHTYISKHGIVNYILSTTCKISMPDLLKSDAVAMNQDIYMRRHV